MKRFMALSSHDVYHRHKVFSNTLKSSLLKAESIVVNTDSPSLYADKPYLQSLLVWQAQQCISHPDAKLESNCVKLIGSDFASKY